MVRATNEGVEVPEGAVDREVDSVAAGIGEAAPTIPEGPTSTTAKAAPGAATGEKVGEDVVRVRAGVEVGGDAPTEVLRTRAE